MLEGFFISLGFIVQPGSKDLQGALPVGEFELLARCCIEAGNRGEELLPEGLHFIIIGVACSLTGILEPFIALLLVNLAIGVKTNVVKVAPLQQTNKFISFLLTIRVDNVHEKTAE